LKFSNQAIVFRKTFPTEPLAMLKIAASIVIILRLIAVAGNSSGAERANDAHEPLGVIQAYLRATYARDFAAAYQFISAEDRKVRDVNRYLQQRGTYGGFALEVARRLSDFVEIQPLKTLLTANGVQLSIRYRVPDPQKIAPLLFNWDAFRLNSLPASEQRKTLDALEKKNRERSLEMSEGEETFALVPEGNEWRVFLNWAAGVKIPLRLDLAKAPELDVAFSRGEFVLQPGDLFEVRLKIKNRAPRPITVRIGHLVEPQTVADFLDFVQCGFLLPVTLQAGKEQEYSGTYMLRGSLPEGVHQLSLTYDFRLLK
jgi:hypothetical protein